MMNHGRFGRVFLESLRENRPEEFKALEEKGELAASAEQVEERAQEQYQDLLSQLQKQPPPPKDASYPQRVQHASVLAQQARELVLYEVVVPNAEDQSDHDSADPY